MVITLSDNKEKLYFPINPEKLSYASATHFQEYFIMNKGAVKVPNGDEATNVGWECFFPGEQLQNAPYVHNWQEPKVIHNRLEQWKQNGEKLMLNITGTPFAFWVYISEYEVTLNDAYGNFYYTIKFSKVIEITVSTTTKAVQRPATTGTERTSPATNTHTVKSGDNLWVISRKYYGTATQALVDKIYNANKDVIEQTAKKYGKKSSNKGWWIYPGTVLNIP